MLSSITPSNSSPSIVSSLINNSFLNKPQDNSSIYKVFDMVSDLYTNIINQMTTVEEKIPAYNYNRLYLEFPSSNLRNVAMSITSKGDSNDVKAQKITSWVLDHISYKLDEDNYGIDEFWAPPNLTLRKGFGDCEDSAFLIHSLMLHAGVPWERLRTYGGIVKAGTGAQTGGHGWTAYKREKDNQWVVLDGSYYPNKLPVDQRPLMKSDKRYIDDYFYLNEFYYVVTDRVNRIRDPDGGELPYVYNKFGGGIFGNDTRITGFIHTTV